MCRCKGLGSWKSFLSCVPHLSGTILSVLSSGLTTGSGYSAVTVTQQVFFSFLSSLWAHTGRLHSLTTVTPLFTDMAGNSPFHKPSPRPEIWPIFERHFMTTVCPTALGGSFQIRWKFSNFQDFNWTLSWWSHLGNDIHWPFDHGRQGLGPSWEWGLGMWGQGNSKPLCLISR